MSDSEQTEKREIPESVAQLEAPDSLVTTLGSRLGTHSAIYMSSAVLSLVLSFVYITVLTRYLSPSEFGRMALLLTFAGLLTILYNLPTLQGTLQWVYGAAGDIDAEDDEAKGEADEKRRALGTGLTITAAISVGGTILVFGLSPIFAKLLSADRLDVMIAALSGALGSIWRKMTQIMRLERKPRHYAVLDALRPFLVLSCVTPLVISGLGLRGAIAGIALGTGLAATASLVATRRTWTLSYSAEDARGILRVGTPLYPIILSYWVIQNVDLFMVSFFLPVADVGVYRLGSRIGSVMSYFVSAFIMGWGPLRRTSGFTAAEEEHGTGGVGGAIATYFTFATFGLLLALVVGADLLVRIAPPSYAKAAPIIPLVAASWMVHGALIVTYRSARFPAKRRAYVRDLVAGVVVFLASGVVLTPMIGNSGAALAVILGLFTAFASMAYRSQRGQSPLGIDFVRLAAGIALSVACGAVALELAPLTGGLAPIVDVASLVAYPILLIALRIVPRSHVQAARSIASAMIRPPARRRLREAIQGLGEADSHALELACRERRDLSDVASALGEQEDEAARRIGGAVRAVAATTSASPERVVTRIRGLGKELDLDGRVASYLFSTAPLPERDELARDLWSSGIGARELHSLEMAVEALKKAPRKMWSASD